MANGWTASAMDYYNACIQGGGTAQQCETAVNNYMQSGGGGFWQNTAGDIAEILGGLAATGANIYGQYSGSGGGLTTAPPPPPPATKKDYTLYYVAGAVVLIVIMVVLMRKK